MSGQGGEQVNSGQVNPNIPDEKVKIIKDTAKLFGLDTSRFFDCRRVLTNSALRSMTLVSPRRRMRASLFLAPLLLAGCASLNERPHQTTYAPTANGVEAHNVSVGPPLERPEVPYSRLGYDIEFAAQILLADSDHLKYLGKISEPLFISGGYFETWLQPSLGANDYPPSDSLCSIWAEHVGQLLDVGPLTYCSDHSFNVESFRDGVWHSPDISFHTLGYEFENLSEVCGDLGGWPQPCVRPPFSNPPPSELPACAAVSAQLFEDKEGRKLALIESADLQVINETDTREQCKKLFRRHRL